MTNNVIAIKPHYSNGRWRIKGEEYHSDVSIIDALVASLCVIELLPIGNYGKK